MLRWRAPIGWLLTGVEVSTWTARIVPATTWQARSRSDVMRCLAAGPRKRTLTNAD